MNALQQPQNPVHEALSVGWKSSPFILSLISGNNPLLKGVAMDELSFLMLIDISSFMYCMIEMLLSTCTGIAISRRISLISAKSKIFESLLRLLLIKSCCIELLLVVGFCRVYIREKWLCSPGNPHSTLLIWHGLLLLNQPSV